MTNKLLIFFFLSLLYLNRGHAQTIELKISSKDSIETKILNDLSFIKTHLNYQTLTQEIDSISKRLFNKGYIESEFEGTHKKNDSLILASFNLKKKYDTIYIYYDKTFDKKILRNISNTINDSYFEIPIEQTEAALHFINSEIANQGRPFSKLKLDNIKVIDNIIKANLTIDSLKNKRTVDNIKIKGYEKFPKAYIKHFLKLKPGVEFNLDRINKKTQRLNNLPFAKQIKTPEVLFTKDSSTLYVYLEKLVSNNFDGFLGFGTNEETNKIEFDGYLKLNLNNNFNYGETFSLLYKSDENEQRTFNINANLPYLFNSPIGTELELNIFRKDSTYNITNQKANLFYQLNSTQKIYAGIETIQSSNLLNNTTFLTLNDYNATFYNLKYEYIFRRQDNFLFPINFSFIANTAFGGRTSNNLKTKQSLLTLSSFKTFQLNNTNSIYLKLAGDYLISDDYLENELRRFGGINSIRGFEENSIFATLYATLNTEYRYQFSRNLYLHSIIDIAYFENRLSAIKEKLFGFGFGFGLLTKSGLLKFNYANGKSESQKFKFSDSKIHLSLTTTF